MMNNFKQKYKFSPTFKIGALLILIFSGLGIAFGVGLFIFGIAWVFMGVYKDPATVDSHLTWGIIMMVLGFYTTMMNFFSLILTANAVNQKNSNRMMWMAIISIAGVVSMIGGIILLFTPVEDKTEKPKRIIEPQDKVHTVIKSHATEQKNTKNSEYENEIKMDQLFLDEEQIKLDKEQELINLKELINSHQATEKEKELFIIKTKEYKEKYSHH